MKNSVLETERLILRKLQPDDLEDLREILQDEKTMYAYEHAFNEEEVISWLEKQLERYRKDGFGLWAVIRKEDGAFVGQAGLTMQDIGEKHPVCEIGYLLKRRYWGNGYATEAAKACKHYAFHTLAYPVVYSIIRDSNQASRRVAERNGMFPVKTIVKHYYNMDMPHLVYRIEKEAEIS